MKKLIIFILICIGLASQAQTNGGIMIVGGVAVNVPDTSTRKVEQAIQSSGVTLTTTQRFAANLLVTNFKVIDTWNDSKAIYGVLGGTAAAHKWNWKDLRDLDAAYRLTYAGTITHDATGMKGDGSTGYANTHLTPSTNLSNINSVSMAVYFTNSASLAPSNWIDMGSIGGDESNQRFALRGGYDNGSNKTASGSIGQISPLTDTYSTSIVFGKAFVLVTRTSSTIHKLFVNGILENTISITNTGTLPSRKFYLLALNSSTLAYQSARTQGFAAIIDSGLTDTKALRQSQVVFWYESILGRN